MEAGLPLPTQTHTVLQTGNFLIIFARLLLVVNVPQYLGPPPFVTLTEEIAPAVFPVTAEAHEVILCLDDVKKRVGFLLRDVIWFLTDILIVDVVSELFSEPIDVHCSYFFYSRV